MPQRYRNPETGEAIEWRGGQWVRVEPDSPGKTAMDLLRNVRSGGTFGWGDEIVGALGALGAGAPGSDRYAQAYERIRSAEEGARDQFAKENPVTALGANIFGGIGTGGALKTLAGPLLARLPSFMQAAPPWLKSTAIGGTAGAVAGAGEAPPGQRGEGAATGAAFGAAAGGLAHLVSKYGQKTLAWLWTKHLASAKRRSANEVLKALEAEGMTPADAEALARAMGDDAVLADAGGRVRSLAVGVEAAPDAPRKAAEQMLRARHAAQQDQLVGALQQATGRQGQTLSYQQALEAARKGATRPLYEAAYATPVPLNQTLSEMLNLPEVRSAYLTGHSIAQVEAGKRLPLLAWDNATKAWANPPTAQEWDWINRGLRNIQYARASNGHRDVALAYGNLRKAMLEEIDGANPAFAAARQAHASGKQIEDALDMGKAFFREKDDELLAQTFNGLSDPEKGAYLEGVTKAIRDRIRTVGANKDVTTQSWLRSPEFRDRMTMLYGQQAADDVFRQVDALAEKAITKNQILHQSMTADKQAALDALASSDLGDVGRRALAQDWMGAADSMRRVMRGKETVPPEVAKELAATLLTPVGQWTDPLADQLGKLQYGPWVSRWQAGAVPPMVPAVLGNAAGLFGTQVME